MQLYSYIYVRVCNRDVVVHLLETQVAADDGEFRPEDLLLAVFAWLPR